MIAFGGVLMVGCGWLLGVLTTHALVDAAADSRAASRLASRLRHHSPAVRRDVRRTLQVAGLSGRSFTVPVPVPQEAGAISSVVAAVEERPDHPTAAVVR